MNNPKSYITKVGIDPTSVFASGGRPADSSRNTWTDHSSQSLVDASVTTHDTSTRNISHVFGSEFVYTVPSSMPNIDHLLRIHSFDDDHPALSVPLPDSPTSSRQSQSSVPSTVMPSRSHSRDRGNVPALKSNHAPFIAPKQASAERPNRSPEASQPESSTIATSTETSVPSRRSRPPPPIHIQSPENSPSEVFSTPGPINPPPTEADSDYLLPQTNNQVPKTSTSIMVPGLTEDPQPEHREANQEDFTATSREPARNGHQGTTSDPHENSPMLIEIHSKLVGTTEGGRGGAERLASSSPGNAFTDASHQSVMDHSVTKHDASITNINYTYGKTSTLFNSIAPPTHSCDKSQQ
ncbi:hypothetical protein SISSUDRAFT_652418 [Sistotremastrum suecicum HHB10207 ss-3]|uniref:Uncharacterized protein n=1 Tax=Sistotremastrum suecicum HHB10207 ss-3 TaxID=1314776 RepID=A0A166E7V2_9AGAM|nr:hypothetical protein SISSUDRAFT_652418 [Sistotremastrum suecicum HHB10207 ss-3]